jgi:hypothetical protein
MATATRARAHLQRQPTSEVALFPLGPQRDARVRVSERLPRLAQFEQRGAAVAVVAAARDDVTCGQVMCVRASRVSSGAEEQLQREARARHACAAAARGFDLCVAKCLPRTRRRKARLYTGASSGSPPASALAPFSALV